MELYLRYDSVLSGGRRIFEAFLPVVLGALVLLAVLQLPLAIRLSRELRDRTRERETLLRRTIDAGDAERRRIAADLHDGIVQEMAALSFELSTAAASEPGTIERRSSSRTLSSASEAIRRMIGELRSLMIEIHPPSLRSAGLPAALEGLVGTLRARGIDASTDVDPDLRLPEEIEALFFRVAQEGLRNVVTHADASEAMVRVWVANGRAHLTIVDDGVGFQAEADGLRTGHLGMHVMHELANDAGGVLEVDSRPGAGTSLRLAVAVPA
jgi:signal transduction histidine kinase